jgi:chemotaxis signal transduction protein
MSELHQADPLLSFAQVALGDLTIGVDTRFVVRAVARPARLTRLPRSDGAVDGVFVDAGKTVPVIDLRRWMGDPATEVAPQVLVLGADGRAVGLAIDAVQGLARVRQSQVRRIHHGDTTDDFFHSVAPGGDGGLLSLLDPVSLMERVQAWAGEAGTNAVLDNSAGTGTLAAPAQPLAQVRLGNTLLAVPAALVAEVLPRPAVQPVLAAQRELLGMVQWRSHHVPMVDLAVALGTQGGAAPLAMVLACGERLVAFPIDEVVAVGALPVDGATRVLEAGVEHPLLRGVVQMAESGRTLLLDGEALLRIHAAPGLSRRERDADTGPRLGKRAPAHVVFDAGRRWAIPIAVLEEILPVPPGGDADAGSQRVLPATFAWRNQTLPLIDLREPGDAKGRQNAPQRLIVVRQAWDDNADDNADSKGKDTGHRSDRYAALHVSDVVELLPAQSGELLQFAAPGGASVRMITVGSNGTRTSYPVLDLASLPFFAPASAADRAGCASRYDRART